MSDPKFMQTTWVIDEHYNEIVIAGYENPFNLHLYGRGKPSDWKEILSVVAAAPDLYAALEEPPFPVLESPYEFIERYKEWYHDTRVSVLAKARGE